MASFRQLRHFVATAELGSLSRAARRVKIVQPALSQSLKRLEEDLGTELFNRSRHGMELNEAGHIFLEAAYSILNRYGRARDDVATISGAPTGKVSLAMTASALRVLARPLCTRVLNTFPGIELNMEEGLTESVQRGLEAGAYDFVVQYFAEPKRGMVIEDLVEEELYLTSAYDPACKGADIPFRELNQRPIILPDGSRGIRLHAEELADDLGVTLMYSQISASLWPTLELIEGGFGVSLLPFSAIQSGLKERRFSARRIVRPKITNRLSIVYFANRPVSKATSAVMNELKRALSAEKKQGRWGGKLMFRSKVLTRPRSGTKAVQE